MGMIYCVVFSQTGVTPQVHLYADEQDALTEYEYLVNGLGLVETAPGHAQQANPYEDPEELMSVDCFIRYVK